MILYQLRHDGLVIEGLPKDLSPFPGVLSEEQIRLKKLKKQQEEESARTSAMRPEMAPRAEVAPRAEAVQLAPQQLEMIEKLVAMQKQCNKRSFLDRPKVTVSVASPR